VAESVEIWQLDRIEAIRGPVDEPLPRTLYEGLLIGLLEAGAVEARYRHSTHKLLKGTLILGQPGEVVSFEPIRGNQPVRICVQCPPDALQDLADDVHGRHTGTPSIGELITPDPQLVGLFRAFHRTLMEPSSSLESSSRAHDMLERIVRVHTKPSSIERSHRSQRALVRRVRAYLDENAATDISLTDLAQMVNASAYYLNRVFRADVGIPPHAYQTQVRIERARELLARGMPVHRVAVELGFYDQSHFTNQFKRLLGYTPSTYRERKILQA
jgi:AraC-like DNA-binding protein